MNINLKEMTAGLRSFRNQAIYFFAGSLIIANIYYAFVEHIENYWLKIYMLIDYISKDIFKFIIFISVSYVVGFFTLSFVSLIPISKSRKLLNADLGEVSYKNEFTIKRCKDEGKYKSYIELIELNDSFVHLIQSIGSSFFISFIIFSISFILHRHSFEIILCSIFLILTIFCELTNRDNEKHLKNTYEAFFEEIKKNP